VHEIGEGWDPLVRHLGVERPDTPFPRLNDTASFREMVGIPALYPWTSPDEKGLTGVDAPDEAPTAPDVELTPELGLPRVVDLVARSPVRATLVTRLAFALLTDSHESQGDTNHRKP
jgi:hypothetical protein